MEEILNAIHLALIEEGFRVTVRPIGRTNYLIVGTEEQLMVKIHQDHIHIPGLIPGLPKSLVPLAHPDSIQLLIDHLTKRLNLATV